MKKLNNKGFTLIEIVIVIVIIAILAAMLVPSLTSWIDKSKQKTFTSACGTIKTAVWSQEAELYALGDTTKSIDMTKVSADVGKTVTKATGKADSGYNVDYSYDTGKIEVWDANWHGTWASNSAVSWDVEKITNS